MEPILEGSNKIKKYGQFDLPIAHVLGEFKKSPLGCSWKLNNENCMLYTISPMVMEMDSYPK